MAGLREKVEAELEQMERALGELPGVRRVNQLSVLELGGTASLLSALCHGVENILKQGLLRRVARPARPYMAFRHFFLHAYGFDSRPPAASATGSGSATDLRQL